MIRVSVLYAAKDGARFAHDSYERTHMPLVRTRLGGNSIADFQTGMKAHGAGLMGDAPNFTPLQPQVQTSEIVG